MDNRINGSSTLGGTSRHRHDVCRHTAQLVEEATVVGLADPMVANIESAAAAEGEDEDPVISVTDQNHGVPSPIRTNGHR